MSKGRLHDLNPTGRFTNRAGDYAKYRPGYPEEAVEFILRGLPAGAAVADVGAGTGIFSRLLACGGARVRAVEPNAAMRAAGEEDEAVAGAIEWVAGTAESTGLEAGSVAVVTCAQAFHWFDAAAALAEFHRILRRGGRIALVWNQRDNDDAFTRSYIEAIREVGGEHHPVEVYSERAFDPGVVAAGGLFTTPVERRWPSDQALTREGLVGRAMSASYTPKDAASRAKLERLLGELFEAFRGGDELVRLRYSTVVYLAERIG